MLLSTCYGLAVSTLLVVPTELEARGLKELGFAPLICGMGPVASAAKVAYELAKHSPDCILLWGLAGAYPGSGLEVPSLVLVTEEFLGDLALCKGEHLEDLASHLPARRRYPLPDPPRRRVHSLLERAGLSPTLGAGVTVSCVSGTRSRGEILARRFGALIENMEGAAVAQAAELAGVEMVELRVVSNLVEDPPQALWKIEEALSLGARALQALKEFIR